jgi:hypothetical protein
MNRIFVSLLLAACPLLAGCFHAVQDDWREYRIFCGMTRSDGAVSETEWERFCEEYVTTEFPDGYTALRATGYWKSDGDSAAMREDARIIVVLAPSGAEDKIRRIARQYGRLFQQEAVLIATSPADAEFVESSSGEAQ